MLAFDGGAGGAGEGSVAGEQHVQLGGGPMQPHEGFAQLDAPLQFASSSTASSSDTVVTCGRSSSGDPMSLASAENGVSEAGEEAEEHVQGPSPFEDGEENGPDEAAPSPIEDLATRHA